MTTLIQFLLSRTDHFIIELNNMSVSAFPSWLEKELLDNPAVIACIESYSYQVTQLPIGSIRVVFSVQYDLFPLSEPVFLSQTLFELITAISSALRLHLSRMIFVIDNRKSNIDVNKTAQLLLATEEFVGEELQISSV